MGKSSNLPKKITQDAPGCQGLNGSSRRRPFWQRTFRCTPRAKLSHRSWACRGILLGSALSKPSMKKYRLRNSEGTSRTRSVPTPPGAALRRCAGCVSRSWGSAAVARCNVDKLPVIPRKSLTFALRVWWPWWALGEPYLLRSKRH